MKLTHLTASTAVLLLSSTTLMAQEATPMNVGNVYVDVGGTAVLVPVAIAAEACGSDVATVQQMAATRLEEQGLDPTMVYNRADTAAEATGTGTVDPASADAGTTTDTAAAEAGASGTAAGTATDAATANAGGAASTGGMAADASSDAGTDTAMADASGAAGQDATAAGTEGTDMAAADAGAGSAGNTATGVENVETTAADTAAGTGMEGMDSSDNEQLLTISVCQVDQARATELGIDSMMAGGAAGTATE